MTELDQALETLRQDMTRSVPAKVPRRGTCCRW